MKVCTLKYESKPGFESISCDRAFILLENSGEVSQQCPFAESFFSPVHRHAPAKPLPIPYTLTTCPFPTSIFCITRVAEFLDMNTESRMDRAFLKEDLKTKK